MTTKKLINPTAIVLCAPDELVDYNVEDYVTTRPVNAPEHLNEQGVLEVVADVDMEDLMEIVSEIKQQLADLQEQMFHGETPADATYYRKDDSDEWVETLDNVTKLH